MYEVNWSKYIRLQDIFIEMTSFICIFSWSVKGAVMGKYNIWYSFFLLKLFGSRRNFLSIEYRSNPSLEVFLLEPCLEGEVASVEASLLDDCGWPVSPILGDFSFRGSCTTEDDLRFKWDWPGDNVVVESEERDSANSARALDRSLVDGWWAGSNVNRLVTPWPSTS